MSEHLNLLYAADENYAPFLGVSVYSLLENNKDIEKISIYAVLDKVSDTNKEKLKTMVGSFGRELVIIDADDVNKLMAELGVPKYRGSYTTHYRKFFSLILPDSIKRFLYIDSDTVVTGSLKKLLQIDMGDAVAGVVLDSLGTPFKPLLGFDKDETYFNAGVTLIDVENWNRCQCTEQLREHITSVRAQYCHPDQDLFNVLLRGKTLVLPPEYNFMPFHAAYPDKAFAKVVGFDNYYSEKEIQCARENKVIIHCFRFLGDFPWHKGNLHPDTKVFDEYLAKTPWKDYEKKLSKNQGLLFKIERILYCILPKGLFFGLFVAITMNGYKRQNRALQRKAVEQIQ